jgi:hypothetical protein
MYKEKITVPRGVKYIGRDWTSEENGYDLKKYDFPHILNKVLTGCGYTEYCLTNDQDLVLISPRKFLLENKLGQHLMDPNIYYAENKTEVLVNYERDISKDKALSEKDKKSNQEKKRESIEEFKRKVIEHVMKCRVAYHKPAKILVTYDSFRHVKEALMSTSEMSQFQVVVDEFQSIFIDARFKSDAELELVNNLQSLRKVCFVSATPMLDKYLEMLDEFKDLPYYELDWVTEEPERVTKPKLDIKFTTKSLNYCVSKVIQNYLAGNFETRTVTYDYGIIGLIESKEAVLFLNSVKGICKAITTNELSQDQCNILCAQTDDNNKQVRDAFNTVIKKKAERTGIKNPELIGSKENVIGEIPLEGKAHKMFTFCTRTVYLGADFYSTCASTYIFSDSNIECLSVDISMDLEQILGRQRKEENPWKNVATMFVKTTRIGLKTTWEEFKARLDEKERKTLSLLSIHQGLSGTRRHDMAENLQKVAKMCHYKDDYVAVNEHAGKDIAPVFNRLMQVSEIRAFELQQTDYADRFTVTSTIQSKGLTGEVRDSKLIKDLAVEFLKITNTEVRLQFIVNFENEDFTEDELNAFFSLIPDKYKDYYKHLGFSGIRAHRYNEAEIKRELEKLCGNSQKEDRLKEEIYRLFKVGNRYTKADIKTTLKNLYERLGYQKTAKATDLESYYNMKSILTSDKKHGFEIQGKKGMA